MFKLASRMTEKNKSHFLKVASALKKKNLYQILVSNVCF